MPQGNRPLAAPAGLRPARIVPRLAATASGAVRFRGRGRSPAGPAQAPAD
ncbi:MAG: hypothetical protein AAGK21_15275 [Bacteroidota bacterium]